MDTWIRRFWTKLPLLVLAILLASLGNGDLLQGLCAGIMIVLIALPLAVESYFHRQGQRSDIANAFSLLSVIIYVFILLGGACFNLWWEGMPYFALLILVVGYVATVIWYVIYFFGGGSTHLGSWDILKGFGGATFAEFAGGVGILVSIGIYLVYTPDEPSFLGGFWWAAQLSAMISIFSAAAWVQRYVLEKPEYPAGKEKDLTTCNRFLKTGPNFLNSIAALLTMLAILFPTEDNRNGLEAALGGGRFWWILIAWIIVILLWGVAALVPLCKLSQSDSWPKNPQPKPEDPPWGTRKTIGLFLVLISLILLMSLSFVIASFVPHDSNWLSNGSQIAAIIAAACFVLGIFWKWVVDQYQEEPDSELKMLIIFRDVALFFCGGVIFVVQIVGVGDPASPLSTLYKFILGMMAYSTLIGILIGAYKWSCKRKPQPALRSSGQTDQAIQIT